MSDITLSSSVRNNLLALQDTANLLASTQERLATGLKVNSALDDPTAFFTASSLNARASDLNRLQDFVGNAVQTLRAADEGIEAITNLVEAAEATARQALQTSGSTTTAITSADASASTVTDDVAAVATSTISVDGAASNIGADLTGLTDGDILTITIGGDSHAVRFNTTGTGSAGADVGFEIGTTNLDAVIASFNGGLANGTVDDGTNDQFVITASANTDDIVISGNTTTAVSAFGLQALGTGTTTLRTVEPTNVDLGVSGNLTLQIGSGTVNTIVFGTDDSSNEVNTRAELITQIGNITGLTGAFASDKLQFSLTSASDSLTIDGDATILSALNVTSGQRLDPTVATASTDRASFATQFDELRTQIDQLAADASFNGVNLLNGDSLTVTFNEDSTSSLGISGVTYNSAGLGVTAAANTFQLDININDALSDLTTATNTLRSQASRFGNNLSVVETRQDFTKNLINVLETGAANLTLADTNEEGANLLALQTRQQLSSTALSLASQADQNVLRLF
ncbi:MAG: flagellin [Pseudomonadota bacterium]